MGYGRFTAEDNRSGAADSIFARVVTSGNSIRFTDHYHAGNFQLVYRGEEHGGGLKIGRIEQDTEHVFAFTVKDPPIEMFDGVVTFRDTQKKYEWLSG